MELSELPLHAGSWLGEAGPEGDIVISARVRLARNIAGYRFATRATPEQLVALRGTLTTILRELRSQDNDIVADLSEATAIDRTFLHERHLISREHAESDRPGRAVVFAADESVAVMVNEEDHLRLQAIRAGLALDQAFREVDALDSRLASRLDFAFHETYGYLTACPTNTGTGLRASVMLHLPALTFKREIDKVIEAVAKVNLVVRGLYGEGTKPLGNFYQVSNQVTLGRSEDDLVERLDQFVRKVIEFERRMRGVLLDEERPRLEDRIWRSYGILRTARIISSEETMEHLSDIRLGINLGVIADLPMATINELFVLTQPAHLQKLKGRELDAEARDEYRAQYIRRRLTSTPPVN